MTPVPWSEVVHTLEPKHPSCIAIIGLRLTAVPVPPSLLHRLDLWKHGFQLIHNALAPCGNHCNHCLIRWPTATPTSGPALLSSPRNLPEVPRFRRPGAFATGTIPKSNWHIATVSATGGYLHGDSDSKHSFSKCKFRKIINFPFV